MTNDGRNMTSVLWKVHAALVLAELGYGGAYILSKMGLDTGVKPLVFAVYRAFMVVITVPPIAYFAEKGQRPPLNLKILLHFVIIGAFGVFGSNVLIMVGLSMTYVALSSLVAILLPVYVFIISALFRLEEIRWRQRDGLAKVGGMISAVAGALLLPLYQGPVILASTYPGGDLDPVAKFQQDAENTLTFLHLQIEAWQLGAILLVLAPLSIAINISLQVKTLKMYPAPFSMVAFAYIFGSVMLATTAVLTVPNPSDWVINKWPALTSVLYGVIPLNLTPVYFPLLKDEMAYNAGAIVCGLINAGANSALMAWAVQKGGPLLSAMYAPVQSFATVFMSYIFLGESIYLGSVCGILLLVNGLFLITWGQILSQRAVAPAVATADGLPILEDDICNLEKPLLG